MAAAPSLAQLQQRADQADSIIALLTKQLSQLEAAGAVSQKEDLKKENEQLKQEIAGLTQRLVTIEASNGETQFYDFSIPSALAGVSGGTTTAPAAASKETSPTPVVEEPVVEKKIKKEKVKREGGGGAKKPAEEDLPVDVGRLDFKVGRIISAEKHPDAESLYVEQVDCGEASPRTVVSGLVKFIPLEEMQNRMVVLLCNLKPAKMRGVTSQAMVMCASTPDKVEILSPPTGSEPGDIVEFEGYTRQPDAVLNPKKKIFEACAPDLQTNDQKVAVYKGVPMTVQNKGAVISQTMAGVQVK